MAKVDFPIKSSMKTIGSHRYFARRISVNTSAPTVTSFIATEYSSSLTIDISSFTATDSVGVTGYLITENTAPPDPNNSLWSNTAPTTYTFDSVGVKVLYAWAKNALDLISMNRHFAVTITSGRVDIGINIGWATDWVQDRVFADLVKTTRVWQYPGYETDWAWVPLPDGYMDGYGWPNRDARIMIANNYDFNGTYGLSFTGYATTIYVENAISNITNIVYNAEINQTTADIRINPTGVLFFVIGFMGTQVGVKNVKVMRPTFPGSNISLPTTALVSNEFAKAVRPFSTIRYMNFLSMNSNLQHIWSDRIRGDYYTNNVSRYQEGAGGALEDIINISNHLHKDAWINIPSEVDDDYIQNVALLFLNGNSYTGNVGLDSTLHLYIEFSNELWNGAYPFLQNGYNHTAAMNEVAAGDLMNLQYDGNTNTWAWAARRVGQKIAQISNIFRAVFGDDAMHTRIRPVLAWQSNFVGGQGEQSLFYLDANKDLFPQPIAYYIYGGGGSAYYGPAANLNYSTLTIDNLWTMSTMDNSAFLLEANNSVLCSMFGIRRIAYEGGPSFDKINNTAVDAILSAAWTDPRITDAVVEHHQTWCSMGGELLMYFTLTHDFQWGMLRTVLDLTHPKYLAIKELELQNPNSVTYGHATGTLVPSNLYNYRMNGRDTSWYQDDRLFFRQWTSPEWYGTTFNVVTAQLYEAAVVYTGGGIGTLEVLIDGILVGSLGMSGPSGTLVSTTVSLSPGLHSVRIKGIGPEGTPQNADLFQVRTVTLREHV